MTHRSSFSQHNSFSKCKRMWFYDKIRKIPVVQDMCYAHAGNVIHKCLELFYNGEIKSLEDMKIRFENMWVGKKLDTTKLKYQKDDYWDMCINGSRLEKTFTSTELKIYYPEVVAYIDGVNSDKNEIVDWKSSKRRPENEEEYTKQLMLYSWLYFRKFNVIPKKVSVQYLRYLGAKGELSISPSIEDIHNIEVWYNDILKEMDEIKESNKIPSRCENCFIFCPFQNVCTSANDEVLKYNLKINGNNIFLDGPISELLHKGLYKKFSYELKDAYFIKKNNPHAKTTVEFWNYNRRLVPLAMKDALIKTLTDYAKFKELEIAIDITDDRTFDETTIKMP